MKYTINELNNIVKTLPIGYYLGQDTKVEVDETIPTSLCNIMTKEIKISYSQIQTTLDEAMDEEESEQMIRSNLYHELSHAILTSKYLKPSYQMNVFEDERIETILQDYYMNVNFKKECKKMNHYVPNEKPKNAEQAFYHLVRFREGDEKWLRKLEELIIKFANLNSQSSEWDVYKYQSKINSFYYDFIDEYNKNKEKEEKESKNNKKEKESSKEENEEENEEENNSSNTNAPDISLNKEDDSSNDNEDDDSSDINNDKDSDSSMSSNKEDDKETNQNNSKSNAYGKNKDYNEDYDDEKHFKSLFTKEEVKEMINKVMNKYNDTKLNDEISSILRNISINSKNNGSAINSYSGVFNPRSVARNDYKYFVQQNREGHQKQFSKIHLNLFIDVSGSFSPAKDITNKILFSLSQFEKQNHNFSFDLITIGMGEKLQDKKHREIDPIGGNLLDNNIFDIFKKVQNPNEYNYNIVLFDGDAESDAFTNNDYREGKPFKAFDRNNTTIITNRANEYYITKNSLTSCKVIYTKDYVFELKNHIFNTLKLMSR